MTVVVIVLVVLAVVIVGVLVLATTKPNRFRVERSGTIAAPPIAVHPLLADFHRWTEWSPWEGLDPDMDRTYSGAEQGLGAVYEWSGNAKAGAGRMEIVAEAEPAGVTIALHFLKPFKSSNTTTFTLTPEGEGTHVNWAMDGPMPFPSKVMSVFTSMDRMIGKDFEKGLAQLKVAAER